MDYIQDVSVPTVGRKVYFLGKVYFSARLGGPTAPRLLCPPLSTGLIYSLTHSRFGYQTVTW